MNSKFLIVGAAAACLIAGSALAQMTPDASAPAGKPGMAHSHMMPHHKAKEKMSEYAAPAAPIAYSDLSKYPSDEKAKPMSMNHKAMKPKTPDTQPPVH